jgi:YgiT-type zinc finger domain-containing protein
MICETCGNKTFHAATSTETFHVGGRLVVVEDIPAQICDRCGAPSFAAQVAERVRRLIHESHAPARVIEAEVLEYHAA